MPDKSLGIMRRAVYFSQVFAIMVVINGLALLIGYHFLVQEVIQDHVLNQSDTLRQMARGVEESLASVTQDLEFLATQRELHHYLSLPGEEGRSDIEEEYRYFSAAKGVYDQIRLIRRDGLEMIRVDLKPSGPVAIPEARLQDKAGRYYVTAAAGLKKGEVYISRFDLNVENGEIEIPFKPMIRFVTQVYDRAGALWGYVVLNYRGQAILDRITREKNPMVQRVLVNEEGYYLAGFRPGDEWGWMFPDRHQIRFSDQFTCWEKILASPTGVCEDGDVLFVHTTIDLLAGKAEAKSRSGEPRQAIGVWTLISRASHDQLVAERKRVFWLLVVVAFLLGAGISLHVANARYGLFLVREKGKDYLAQIKGMNLNLMEKNQALEQGNQALAKANSDKNRLFSVIAHDIRSPLITLLGYPEIILNDPASFTKEEVVKYLKTMYGAGKGLVDLVEHLLDWSRVQITRNEAPRYALDTRTLMDQALILMAPLADAKEIRLSSEVSGDFTVLANPEDVQIILRNLLGNAIKFTPRAGRITCRVEPAPEGIELSISDSGVGVGQDLMTDLFKIEVKTSTRGTEGEVGTGMGLPLCHDLATRNQGRLRVESREGEGTTFFLILPAP